MLRDPGFAGVAGLQDCQHALSLLLELSKPVEVGDPVKGARSVECRKKSGREQEMGLMTCWGGDGWNECYMTFEGLRWAS